MEASFYDVPYYRFMFFIALNIFVIIISFATDFVCLSQVDKFSLQGIPLHSSLFERIFECFYFSVLNFSFFGYGDILPRTVPAKIILMEEALLSFLTMILVLSDFISLKDSIADIRTKNKQELR